MKNQITIQSSKLKELLTFSTKVASSNNTIPILENVLFTVKGNDVTITASDLTNTIQITTKEIIQSSNDFSFLIEPKKTIDTVALLAEQPITITYNTEKDCVILKTTNEGSYKVASENPKDFITTPENNTSNTIEVNDFKLFAKSLKKAKAFQSENFNFISVQANESDLTIKSTNSYMIFSYENQHLTEATEEPFEFAISPKLCDVLDSIDFGDTVYIEVGNMITITSSDSNRKVISRKPEGVFPKAYFSKDDYISIEIPKNSLSHASKVGSSFSDIENPKMYVSINDENFSVTAEKTQKQVKADVFYTLSVPSTHNEPINFAINSKFLNMAVSQMQEENIELLINPIDKNEKELCVKPIYLIDSNTQYLIMPIGQ